jgi:hypothetical protein
MAWHLGVDFGAHVYAQCGAAALMPSGKAPPPNKYTNSTAIRAFVTKAGLRQAKLNAKSPTASHSVNVSLTGMRCRYQSVNVEDRMRTCSVLVGKIRHRAALLADYAYATWLRDNNQSTAGMPDADRNFWLGCMSYFVPGTNWQVKELCDKLPPMHSATATTTMATAITTTITDCTTCALASAIVSMAQLPPTPPPPLQSPLPPTAAAHGSTHGHC